MRRIAWAAAGLLAVAIWPACVQMARAAEDRDPHFSTLVYRTVADSDATNQAHYQEVRWGYGWGYGRPYYGGYWGGYYPAPYRTYYGGGYAYPYSSYYYGYPSYSYYGAPPSPYYSGYGTYGSFYWPNGGVSWGW